MFIKVKHIFLTSGKYLVACSMFSSYSTLSHFDLTIDGTAINASNKIGTEYASTNGKLTLLSANSNGSSVGGYQSISVLVKLELNTDANVGISYTSYTNSDGMVVFFFK